MRLPDGSHASAIVLAYPRVPPSLRAMTGLGFAAGCAVFALVPRVSETRYDSPASRAFMLFAAILIAVATASALIRRNADQNAVALTAHGLLQRADGTTRYVRWASVTDVRRRDVYGTQFVTVIAQSADAITRSGAAGLLDTVGAIVVRRNQLQFALDNLALSPDEVAGLVQEFHVRSQAGTQPESVGGSQDGADPAWFDRLREAATAS